MQIFLTNALLIFSKHVQSTSKKKCCPCVYMAEAKTRKAAALWYICVRKTSAPRPQPAVTFTGPQNDCAKMVRWNLQRPHPGTTWDPQSSKW